MLVCTCSSCPETPTAFPFPIGLSQVPLNGEGVPGTSYGLPRFGSWPSVLSVPQSNRQSPGHPKDSHIFEVVPVSCLSYSLTGSPWDIPVGLPPLAVVPVSCLSHSPPRSPQDIPRTPTLGSVLSIPHPTGSFWDT